MKAVISLKRHSMQLLAEDDYNVLNRGTRTRTLPFDDENNNSGLEDAQRWEDHIETGALRFGRCPH